MEKGIILNNKDTTSTYKSLLSDVKRWKTVKGYNISEKDFIDYLKLNYLIIDKHRMNIEDVIIVKPEQDIDDTTGRMFSNKE